MTNEVNTAPRIVIAIDGYSSSGKSTMARALAASLGYRYIDSGAMYRAVTLYALEHGMINPKDNIIDEEALDAALPEIKIDFLPQPDGAQHTLLNGKDVETGIRSLEVAEHVSQIAALHKVRAQLTEKQRELGNAKGIVMDGRDIGTTVFPNAELKIFVNASPEVRARRRFKEMQEKGQQATYEEVLENVRHRDLLDTTRKESPLRKASDAVELDNGGMSTDEQHRFLIKLVYERLKALQQK